MNNKVKTLFLMFPFLGLFGWLMYCVNFVQTAQEVRLPIQGYDPRNLLSGHYIQFQIKWDEADCFQADWQGVCPVEEFSGIDRFYVPEDKAKKMERQIDDPHLKAEVLFAYQKGKRPIAKDLIFKERPPVLFYGALKGSVIDR